MKIHLKTLCVVNNNNNSTLFVLLLWRFCSFLSRRFDDRRRLRRRLFERFFSSLLLSVHHMMGFVFPINRNPKRLRVSDSKRVCLFFLASGTKRQNGAKVRHRRERPVDDDNFAMQRTRGGRTPVARARDGFLGLCAQRESAGRRENGGRGGDYGGWFRGSHE